MDKTLRSNLLRAAAAFKKHSGLSYSTIAMHALGNSRFFDTLVKKKDFYVGTYDKLMEYVAARMPAASWPKGVARPKVRPVKVAFRKAA